MPLHVTCPNGCEIRMSRNRSGRVVRCPQCKSALRIPKIAEEILQANDVIECTARLAKRKSKSRSDVADASVSNLDKDRAFESDNHFGTDDSLVAEQAIENASTETSDSTQESKTEIRPEEESREVLEIAALSDASTEENGTESQITEDIESESTVSEVVETESPDSLAESKPLSVPEIDTKKLGKAAELDAEITSTSPRTPQFPGRLDVPVPVAPSGENFISLTGADNQPDPFVVDTESLPVEEVDNRSWEERLEDANSDRRILARFFAICLCIVAIINMIPAIYQWYHWSQLTDGVALPRWIYIQILVGAVYLLYAFFLAQIPDWSALRAVAVAVLAMAFVFALVSTGLLIGGGQGAFTGFLGIPFSLNRQACIWCVAMFCLATLMSYWGGKESMNWQRAEVLLREILNRSGAPA